MFNWFFNIFKVAKKQTQDSSQNKATYQESVNDKISQILTDDTAYIDGIPFSEVVSIIFNSIYNKTNGKGLSNSYKTALAGAEGNEKDTAATLSLDYILISFYLHSTTGKENVLAKVGEKANVAEVKQVLSTEIAQDIIGTSQKNLGLKNLLKKHYEETKNDFIPDSSTEVKDEEGNSQTALDVIPESNTDQPDSKLLKEEEKRDIKKVLSRVRVSKEIDPDTKKALISWLKNIGASMERAPEFGKDFDDKAAYSRMPKSVAKYVGILEDTDAKGDFLNKAINTTKISVPAISSEKISLEELSEIVEVTEKTNLLFRNIASGRENLFVLAGELLNHYKNVESLLENIEKKVNDSTLSEKDGTRLSYAIRKETHYSQLKQFVDRFDSIKGLRDVIEESDKTKGTPAYNDYDEQRKEYYGALNGVFDAKISTGKEPVEQEDTITDDKVEKALADVNEAKNSYDSLTTQLKNVKDKDSSVYQDLFAKVNSAHAKYAQQLRAYNMLVNKFKKENIPTSVDSEPKDVSFSKYAKEAAKSVAGRLKYLKKLLIMNKANATTNALTTSLEDINETRAKALKELATAKDVTADEKTLFKKYIATAAYGATNRVTAAALDNTIGGSSRINTEILNEQFADVLMNSVMWDKANAVSYLKSKDAATETTYAEAVKAFKSLFDDSVSVLTDEQKEDVLKNGVKSASDVLYNVYVNPEEATLQNDYISQERTQDFLNILSKNALNSQDAADRSSLRKEYADHYGTPLDTTHVEFETIQQDLDNGVLDRVISPKENEIGENVLEELNTVREQLKQKENRKKKIEFNKAKTEWLLQDIDNKQKDLEKKLQDKDLPEDQKQALQKEYKELESKRTNLLGDLKKYAGEVKALDSDREYLSKKIDALYNKSTTVDPKSAAGVWADKHSTDPEVLKNYEYYYQDGELIPAVEHAGYWFPIYTDYQGAKQLDDTPLKDPVIIRKEDKDVYKKEVNGETYIRDSETGLYYKVDKETNSIENAVPHHDLPKEKPVKQEVKPDNAEEVEQEQPSDAVVKEKEENPFWNKNVAPKLNEPLPLKTNVEEPKEEKDTEEENQVDSNTDEDIVNPTAVEENKTAADGFYFGIQKTAAFFKFAESDDNYTEDNALANKKEQKAIETGDMEGGFSYTPKEQSLVDDTEDNTEFSMEKLGKVLKQIKTKSPEKWQEVLDLVKQSSAKSGDDLAIFMELWANNDWNASAALRDYNASAVEQRDNNYFYSMYERNVWPAIQTMPAVVNIVNSLSKNEVVDSSDVDTNEYKNV